MTLEELTALFERGLEKWPDGVTARCVINGEAYETLAIGYVLNGTTRDRDVIQLMAELVEELKIKRSARFISWRAPLDWHQDGKRILRCRVLITAKTGDPDWPSKPLEGGD